MTFIKALCIAFSIYSKIPVPTFEWKDEEFKYNLIFFPWVGAVIGVLLMLWSCAAGMLGIDNIIFAFIAAAIPLIVTGGFHVDGYMDVMDAFASHGTREEKLKILKDPHIGAFSVIMLALLGLIYVSAMALVSRNCIMVIACSFFFARALSGISVLRFPKAKHDGMLYSFSEAAGDERAVTVILAVQAAACAALMIASEPVCGAVSAAVGLAVFGYYRYRSMREFGGTTGDAAGYFVTVAETAMCAAAAAYSVVCAVI